MKIALKFAFVVMVAITVFCMPRSVKAAGCDSACQSCMGSCSAAFNQCASQCWERNAPCMNACGAQMTICTNACYGL